MRRNEPHWLLSEQDAKTYGNAIANAMRHLPIGASQKAVDFSALLFCIVNMETPRVYASIQIGRERERQRRQAAQPAATVYPFPSSPSSPPPPPRSPPPQATAGPSPGGGLGPGVVGAVVREEQPREPGAFDLEGFAVDGIDGPIGGH